MPTEHTRPLNERAGALEPGARAPRFMLADGPATRLGLADFAGRWLVVAFHVADWDPVAESQLRSLSDHAADLGRRGIDVVSISSDTLWSHAAFARAADIRVPLLADDHPPASTATAYGLGTDRKARAVFLIDRAGHVAWAQVVDARVDPGVDGLLSAIERLVNPGSAAQARSD